jgi:hypothetical protein
MTTGALLAASRLKVGLAQRRGVEGGGKGTEGDDVDGAALREAGSGTVTGVWDDDGGTAGSIEAEGGVGNGVGATGSGMVQQGRGWQRGLGTTTGAQGGVGDDDRGTAGGVEAEGGVSNGVGMTGSGMV